MNEFQIGDRVDVEVAQWVDGPGAVIPALTVIAVYRGTVEERRAQHPRYLILFDEPLDTILGAMRRRWCTPGTMRSLSLLERIAEAAQ